MKCTITKYPHNAQRVKFHIPYKAFEWRELIKQIPTIFYHKNQKLWSISNSIEHKRSLTDIVGAENIVVTETGKSALPHFKMSEYIDEHLLKFETKIILKGYSKNTIAAYKSNLMFFLKNFEGRDLLTVTKEEIEGYVAMLITKHKISESKQNIIINAIKFYYESVLEQPRAIYDIQRPKKSQTLPNILSEDDCTSVIYNPKNIKHMAILWSIYALGLRIEEITKLRLEDVRSKEGYVFIKGAKGKKDRRVVLSDHLVDLLRDYYLEYKPSYWLFEGQSGGQYSISSIRKVFRKAAKAANISPWATPHTLRHSFATHLVQSGVNLRYVQIMMGHSSPKTTEIYTKILHINNDNVKSPLDKLVEKRKRSRDK